MPTAMVTFNGRITLPPTLRKELGLKTGDSVDFVEIEKGRFAILPGDGSITRSTADPKGWMPKLDFPPAFDEPVSEEIDETIQ